MGPIFTKWHPKAWPAGGAGDLPGYPFHKEMENISTKWHPKAWPAGQAATGEGCNQL
jgi:hypothetical protein